MSDRLPERPAELLNPATGEVLPATAENAAAVLATLRDLRRRMLEGIKACEAILAEESSRVGSKTLRFAGATVEISGGSKVAWDVELLRAGLTAAGCPEERLDELVTATVEYKVNQAVARQLAAANPAYGAAIEAAKTRAPDATRVSVKEGR